MSTLFEFSYHMHTLLVGKRATKISVWWRYQMVWFVRPSVLKVLRNKLITKPREKVV